MEIVVRKARAEDRAAAVAAEMKAMPGLHYLDAVYDDWLADREGELLVAELDGQVAGVGKFSVVPDGSAWLETLRVAPEYQGRGVGKRFYERFRELARQKNINTMRMYTNLDNYASKGLAELYGLKLAGIYQEGTLDVRTAAAGSIAGDFRPVADPDRAATLLLPLTETWAGHAIMNRTFYSLTPALCAAFAVEGKVYEDTATGSVITLGARFLPQQALHIALFGGCRQACLEFARQKAAAAGIPALKCMFSPDALPERAALEDYGFTVGPADFIVMAGQVIG